MRILTPTNLSMSSSSKVISDIVFELRSELANIWMKGIKNGWIIKMSLWIISVYVSEEMVYFVQEKVRNKLRISRASYLVIVTYFTWV